MSIEPALLKEEALKIFFKRVLDIRVLWIFAPIWGNLIFLPMLLSAVFASPDRAHNRFVKAYVITALMFFGYFALRGFIALPDPGLNGALSRISPILLIALIVWIRPPDVEREIRLVIVAIVPMIVVLIGLIERATIENHARIELLAGNPLFLTPALIPLGLLNGFLALRSKTAVLQTLHYSGLFAVLLAIGTLAGSRSSFAVILGGLMIHILWLWVFPLAIVRQRALRHTVFVIGAAAVSFWCATNLGPSADRMSEFASATSEVFSSSIRLEIWRGALSAILEAPVFGYGPQNRWAGMEGFLSDDTFSRGLSHPHNLLMTYGLAGGVVGILAGLAYLLIPNAILLFSARFSFADKELFLSVPATVFAFGLANYILFEAFMATVTTLALLGPFYLLTGRRDDRYHW